MTRFLKGTDRPLAEAGSPPGNPRWLSIDGVLRKMRKRVEALEQQ